MSIFKDKRINVSLLCIISLLEGMVFYASVATLYRQSCGLTVFQITLIESICLILSLIFEIPWGVIADRIGYRKTLIICQLLFFTSKIIFWRADNFAMFLFERIILSVVISGFSGVDESVLYLSCDKNKFQKICGINSSCGEAGMLFATAIFTLFIGSNFRLAGFLTMIPYGISAVLSFFLVEVKDTEKEEKPTAKMFIGELFNTLKNKYLIIFVIAGAMLGEVHQTITVFLNQIKYTACGMSSSSIGVVYFIMTLLGLLAGFSYRVTNRLGVLKTGIVMFGAAGVSCFALAFTQSSAIAVASVFLIYVALFLYRPMHSDLENRQISSQNRATVLSINALIYDGIGVFANLLFGKLADVSLTGSFSFGGVMCVCALLLFVIWYFSVGKNLKKEKST